MRDPRIQPRTKASRVLLWYLVAAGLAAGVGTAQASEVTRQPKASGVVYLSELQPLAASQAWGALGIDASVNKGRLSIGGRVYHKGLGTHADSELVYYLGGEAGWFLADIGIDDEVPVTTPCNGAAFGVYADGRVLGMWGPLRPSDLSMSIRVPVRGARVLTLVTHDMGDNGSDHSDWADARVVGTGEDLAARLRSQSRQRVEYVVSIPQPESARVALSCRIIRPAPFPWDIVIVSDMAPPQSFQACGPAGMAVTVDALEDGKRWRLKAPPSDWIGFQLTRVIKPGRFDGQEKYIQYLGPGFGIFDGHYFFAGPEAMWNSPDEMAQEYAIGVRFELPDGWAAVTPWELSAGCHIPQTPASMWGAFGVFPQKRVRVGGRQVGNTSLVVAFPREANPAHDAPMLDKLSAVFESYNALWGEFPYGKYLVLFSPRTPDGLWVYTSSGSHANSFVARAGVHDWYYLAHEMHHSFNNLIFRHSRQDMVWYQECFNEYFPLRVRCELGLQPGSFHQNLYSHHYRNYRDRVVGTPFDVPVYRGEEFLHTHPDVHSALTYMKPPCIAFLMDQRIRELSSGRRSLDDFARYAFAQAMDRWPSKQGLPETIADVQRQLESFTGASWQGFFDDYVRGTKTLPLDRYIVSP